MPRSLGGFAMSHPISFATAVTLARLSLVVGLASGTTALGLRGEWQGTLVNAICALAALGLTGWLGWWRPSTLAVLRPRCWWPLAGLLLGVVAYLPFGVDPARRPLLPFLLGMLLVGLNEELFYRGVVQHALTTLGRWRCCLLAGVLFGGGHVSRAMIAGASLEDTGLLVLETAGFGFAYAAVRSRVGALWPLVLLHAAVDTVLLLNAGSPPVAYRAIEWLTLICWGALLLAVTPALGRCAKHWLPIDHEPFVRMAELVDNIIEHGGRAPQRNNVDARAARRPRRR